MVYSFLDSLVCYLTNSWVSGMLQLELGYVNPWDPWCTTFLKLVFFVFVKVHGPELICCKFLYSSLLFPDDLSVFLDDWAWPWGVEVEFCRITFEPVSPSMDISLVNYYIYGFNLGISLLNLDRFMFLALPWCLRRKQRNIWLHDLGCCRHTRSWISWNLVFYLYSVSSWFKGFASWIWGYVGQCVTFW